MTKPDLAGRDFRFFVDDPHAPPDDDGHGWSEIGAAVQGSNAAMAAAELREQVPPGTPLNNRAQRRRAAAKLRRGA